MSAFQIKVWRQIPQYESVFSRRKRVFKRLRIAGYAVQFLVFYRTEQIKRQNRQRQMQQFLRNPLISTKRGALVVQSAKSNRSPKSPTPSENKIRRNATDYFEIDSIKEKMSFNDHCSTLIVCQNQSIKKRQVSLYMEEMLKNITTKQSIAMSLTPLSIIVLCFNMFSQDKKLKKNKSIPCITEQISPKYSLDNLQLEKLLTPLNLLQRGKRNQSNIHIFHNEYSNNNKEVIKMIDNLKIKHRKLKRKN
ncbi:unnamed protein product (macronuclear) [Paramecium tetraurelia]|uniref:Uncharacterized protein n=1 Tax=Paramecium tetraurelia TaxID=5888 RepID=A0E1A5_PARTE|nr:uncharacterized protein GSPATT00022241001 [Paramecium tetraurelia]CAK89072.1 unnamed protein product [Paramecium tetraurelia]|eukprot:XP_001456469.1 hypothetical protein (macronuclear) [Paramecium tetraurelia strain d4-2]